GALHQVFDDLARFLDERHGDDPLEGEEAVLFVGANLGAGWHLYLQPSTREASVRDDIIHVRRNFRVEVPDHHFHPSNYRWLCILAVGCWCGAHRRNPFLEPLSTLTALLAGMQRGGRALSNNRADRQAEVA